MRNKNYKHILNYTIILLVGLVTQFSFAQQNILISQGGSVAVANGDNFYDAGGAAGNDGNTSYTITLTPPAGQSVCVDFTSFSSYESLDIFDGTTVAATNIGTLKGNYGTAYNAAGAPYNTGQPALGGVVQAELKPGIFCANNATGALTFRFTNAGASQSTGWVGSIITYAKPTTGCTIAISAAPTTLCLGASTTLTATGTIGSALINNDFNASSLGSGWSATPGGVAFVNVLGCQPNYGYNTQNTDTSIFAWMQSVVAPRTLESNGFDVSNGGVLSFDFREASDDNGGNGCEALDDKEGVYIQYSTNNGTTWNNMKLMFASVESNFPSAANIGCGTYVYNWNTTTVPIPAGAMTANTKFRWYQNSSTTASQDSWGIDNVKIIKNVTSTITITDLLTNTVVATSNTTSASVSVSPASTRTYRATITDGVTSCSNDVTITVNGGIPTTINYVGSPFVPSAGASNVTVTNGPVSGSYTATPAGLTINAASGQITPSTSTPGTYTVSVPTSCGTATATVVIASSACATCATASCAVISLTTTTAALGQTGIATNLGVAGDQLGNAPLTPSQNITVCVPVTVVAGSTILGFKQLTSSSPAACGSPLEEVITYQLTNTACGATIVPNRTNASAVASGFNPEWDGLAAGNYVLCFTMNVTASAICTSVDLQGLGYYNVVPVCSNPVISSQPLTTQTLCKNAVPTNLSITATGTALTYQWYSNASNSNVGGTLIPSATSATYSPSTSVVGTFYFYCVVTSGACTTASTVSTVIVNNSIPPTYTKTVTACSPGSISFSSILPAGTTFNWLSGPSGYVFPAGFQTALTSNTSLSALPAGTYCVDITSPTSAGGTVTSTLFTETFEAGLANWTLDNTNGPNIFVLNNQYVGGTCVTGLGTFTVPAVPNQPVAVTAGPTSNYLHIKATTTTGAVCGGGSVNFIPLNANFDGQISDQKATLNTVINTIGKTNVRFNFYWLAQGETNANGSDDYGSIEYSINGGVTWVMSGARLRRQTTWLSDFRTDPLWDNQANLRFRIRWNNDASSSIDPPISIDEIVITADSTTVASCGSTVNECIVISATPAAPAVTVTQPTCTVATGSVTITTVAGETYSFDGSAYTATATYGGLAAGSSHTIFAKNGSGCISLVTNVTINAQPLTPAAPAVTVTQPTCTVATGLVTITTVAGETYSFDGSAYTATATYGGLAAGSSHTVFAKNGSGCTSLVTNVTINAQPLTPAAPAVTVTQPTCTVATGSVTITTVAGETYSFDGSAYAATATYGGLAAGSSHTIFAKNGSGCISLVTNVTINAQPLTPAAPAVTVTQPTCTVATGSVTITTVAGETYSFDGSAYAATATYGGLAAGSSHTVFAKNGSGCISLVTNVSINAQPLTPAAPAVTVTQPTCTVATGLVTITTVAGETYSFDGSAYTATATYSGLAAGSSHTVFAKNGSGCISLVTNVTINAQPLTPAVPVVTVTQPTCTVATGSVTITTVAGETYSFDGSAYTATATYGGLAAGSSHTIFAKNGSGCISLVTNVTINAQPLTPAAPAVTVTQPTCTVATGSVTITTVAGETYSFDGSAYTATATYGGLAAGSSHTIFAKNGSGCISLVTNVTINAQPLTPAAPAVTVTQPTCTVATGSVTITTVAGETYSFDGSAYAATATYSGLAAGSSHTVFAKNGSGCTSLVTNVTINAQPLTPAAPAITVTQPTCTVATGSVTITTVAGETYSFDGSAYTATATYGGLAAGSSHTVFAKNGSGCISLVTNVTINAQPLTPAAPAITVTQPTCTVATGSVTITTVAGETYSFDGSAYTATATYGGLAAGSSHTIFAKNGSGCISLVTNVSINAQPLTPAAPAVTVTQPTCTVATGSVTITTVAGETYSFDGSAYTATATYGGLAAGSSHTIFAKNGSGCISLVTNVTINAQPLTPAAPAVTVTQPTCSVNSGTITVTSPVAGSGVTYTLIGTLPVVSAMTNSTGVFSGLASGNYNVTTTANGCTSPAVSLIINAQPITPIFSLQDDIICSNDNIGKRLDTGLNATYTYVWEKDGVVIPNTLPYLDVTQSGLYKVTVSDMSICTVSDSAVISLSMTPKITSVTASSYFEDATFITVNVTPLSADYEYALDNGAFQDENTFYNLPRGAYTVTVRNKLGCGEDSSLVSIVNYPHYFTPNGDGYHETWNILDLKNQIASKIYIFDRFGKLIKEIRPSGTGWDGTFNGQPLPSTDYWFVVYYDENGVSKEFRAHFSLKR